MKAQNVPKRKITRLHLSIVVGVFMVVMAAITLPFYAAQSSSAPAGSASPGISPNSNATTLAPRMSIFQPPLPEPQSSPASLATYASDCTTPQTTFTVGSTVCVKVTGVALFPTRRLTWSAPGSTIVRQTDITSDPKTDSLLITATSVVSGNTIDNRGTWNLAIRNPFFFFTELSASFSVVDPANATADLSIATILTPGSVQAGAQAVFELQVTNLGPDDSANVKLTHAVPEDTTFVSFEQLSGPIFTCVNPSYGETGTSTCSIASLNRSDPAIFIATYKVNNEVPTGTEISNTAEIAGLTANNPTGTDDQNSQNNSTTATTAVLSSPCVITCPENITVSADAGQAGAVVTYPTPTTTGDCGQASVDENGNPIPAVTSSPASGSFFPVGTTTVVAFGANGGACTFQVTVDNPGGLSISLNGANPFVTECGTDFNDPGASAVNGTGQSVPVTVTLPSGFDPNNPAVGSYTITYTATEDPNSVSTTRTVNVTDNEAPSIAVQGANPYRIQQGSCASFVDPGVSANDGCAGPKPVSSSISGPNGLTSVDPNTPGTYTVTYTATDGSHQATATRTVIVGNFPEDEVDQPASSNTPPTITLNGDDQMTIECGTPFTDPGATAAVCGGSVPVTTSGTVDIHTPGTYTITYTATANNLTTTAHRTVTVEPDNSAPTITLNGANPIYVECHTGAFTDPGATAHDACAGDFAATASGSVNVDVVGPYTITYNATDPSGHAAAAITRTVIVRDTTAPTVTAPANVTVYTGPGNTSCSATVSDATLGTGSASDACQGSLPTTRSGVPAGNVFAGTTTVTYSATDAAGNTGTATQTVTVVDNTPPTISCAADIVADYDAAVNGAVVTYTAPVGTDNCASTTTQTAGLASGSTFPIGTTTNTFRVTDGAGNFAECSFKVTVALTSLIGLDSVTITGSAYADSYSSAGGYPATKGSLANILSNGTITMGNSAKVWGNVRSTRANVNMTGSSQVTGNATAGTTVTTSGSASVGGTRTNNALAPVMTLPSVQACSPFSSNSGITGTYSYNASTGDLTLSGVNIATLANGNYCFHNVTLGNSSQLKVNGPVVIKLTGTLNTSGATSINNTTQIPNNLRILSSYSGSNGMILGNSANTYAVIYAPNTGFNSSGSAPLFGTVAGKSITIGNSGAIHYDTTLKSIWPGMWTLIVGP